MLGKIRNEKQTNIYILSEFRLVSGDAGNTGRSEGEKVFCEKCTQTLSIGTHWSLLSPSNSINPMETENLEIKKRNSLDADQKTMFHYLSPLLKVKGRVSPTAPPEITNTNAKNGPKLTWIQKKTKREL